MPPRLPTDIRSAPLLPTRVQARALARRALSITALVVLDVGGLAGALYLALVLREVYYGAGPVLWGLAWDAEQKWLPFLTVVTVLVFLRGGLYAAREQRAGVGRVVSSLLLVTVITLAFAVGTGYQHTTFGLYLTAFVLGAIVISGLRASYEIVTGDLWRVAGVRRRAVLVGEGAAARVAAAHARARSRRHRLRLRRRPLRRRRRHRAAAARAARGAVGRARDPDRRRADRERRGHPGRRSCWSSPRRRTGTA